MYVQNKPNSNYAILKKNNLKQKKLFISIKLRNKLFTRVDPLLPAAEHSPAAAGVVLLLAAVV